MAPAADHHGRPCWPTRGGVWEAWHRRRRRRGRYPTPVGHADGRPRHGRRARAAGQRSPGGWLALVCRWRRPAAFLYPPMSSVGGGVRCSRCARWGAPAARPATAGPPWRGAASWPRGGPPRRRRGRTPTAGGGGEQPRPGGARGGGAPRPKSAAAVGECGGEPPQRQRRAAAGGPGTVWGVWRQRRPSRLHPPVARGVGRRASCMPDVDGLPLEEGGGEGAADRGGPRQYALQGGWRPRAVVW